MTAVIFDPLEEFETKYQKLHEENTEKFLKDLVQKSGVDIAQNRKTVQLYDHYRERVAQQRKKLNWLRFFRVLMCITILLIPLVIWKITPKIQRLRKEIAEADKKTEELLVTAGRQMLPLNRLFTDRDALTIIQTTIPLISFDSYFSVQQEADMRLNYDFTGYNRAEQSTLDTLAGNYNGNPFLLENKRIRTMGTETYHGYKTIHWTETYFDSEGNLKTRTESQTLHATVTKPKPFYHTQVVLHYCSQGAPDLTFTRDASHLDEKNERQLERYVRRGERRLERKTEQSIAKNQDFMSMSNTEFEVLFDALDRNNEVQFRTLFTPLAQTNMVSLLLSDNGYGDDFCFIKAKRTNRIISEHSQGRPINLLPKDYVSYSFDVIKENFVKKNRDYFKAVYFDFAPLWAIPAYQERPVHSLKPIPPLSQRYSLKTFEVLANAVDEKYVVHPATKTQAILKSKFIGSQGNVDKTCITAYSYDIEKRVDHVAMLGDDGRVHHVPVEWDYYLPLEASHIFYVAESDIVGKKQSVAKRNGLRIFQ